MKLHRLILDAAGPNPEYDWSNVLTRIDSHPEEAKHQIHSVTSALCLAIFHGGPVEIVDALVKTCPEAVSISYTETAYGYRIGTVVENPNGLTALHFAARFSPPQVLLRLLPYYPEHVLRSESNYLSPLGYLYKYHFGPQSKSKATDESRARALTNAGVLARARGDSQKDVEHSSFILHDLVKYMNHMEGTELIRYAAEKRRGELCRVDSDGNTALHIVCAVDGTKPDSAGLSTNAIKILASACPKAAEIKNNKNELPLAVAVRNVKDQHLECLVRANAAAVHQVDQATGLYPFMTAASIIGSDKRSKARHVSTIYTLLRACPELHRMDTGS